MPNVSQHSKQDSTTTNSTTSTSSTNTTSNSNSSSSSSSTLNSDFPEQEEDDDEDAVNVNGIMVARGLLNHLAEATAEDVKEDPSLANDLVDVGGYKLPRNLVKQVFESLTSGNDEGN